MPRRRIGARGLDLVLIARNGELLNEVARGVRGRHGVEARPLVQDLTDAEVAAKVADATEGLDVGLVIYNAGASDRTTTFLETGSDYALKQIKLDCIGPVALVDLFAPAMRDRGRGGIVLVASLACVAGSATLAVYSAVKAFQHNFAEGLWAELREYGVDVCCTPLGYDIHPGAAAHGCRVRPGVRDAVRGRRARDRARTSATARYMSWGRTTGRWRRRSGPSIGARLSR